MRPPDLTAPRAGQTPGLTSVVGRRYIDDVVDGYVSWREACVVVSDADDNWKRAGREDAKLAFSEYAAALNCEEEAAARYQHAVERLAAMTLA
jgi:hypothetical protein